MAIGNSLRTVHHNLCAIVQLWDAAYSQQQCQALLQCDNILSVTKEAVGIVVVEEGHHAGRIGIQIVVAERVVEAVHATPPAVGNLVLGRVELLLEREVHDGLQVAVLLAQL